MASVSDNCACSSSDESESCVGREPITITQSPAPGTVVGLGPHTITLTANDGVQAVFAAGGVINDHHGVGLKLAPYMERQHGAALGAMRRIKAALDPNGIMNPGKLGL